MTELKHYGVLGMKWGVRRARKYQEKSRRAKAKGNTQGSQKYAAKAEKIKSKHIRRTDKKTYNLVSKTSTGKLLAQSLMMGTYGSLKYNQARANNSTRGKAVIDGVLNGLGDYASGGLLSMIEPRMKRK